MNSYSEKNKGCRTKVSLLFFVLCLQLVTGCSSKKDEPFAFLQNYESKKINNLLDLDNDKKSDLVFWNTSSMSKSNKYLEPCFFEGIKSDKKKYFKFNFGEIGDIPLLGYFDGDEIVDFVLYRYGENKNSFIIETSENKNKYNLEVGSKSDIPIPNDYNGDGRYDAVVFNPQRGIFYGVLSGTGARFQISHGRPHDIPVPKDYDGDGRCDIATYNLLDGTWLIKTSTSDSVIERKFGGKNFLPIPQDYDGDSKADLCIWNFKTNEIKAILTSLSRPISNETSKKIKDTLGQKEFFPISLDYDGNGASELSFWDNSRKILISFDISNGFKYNVYHYDKITNSIPVYNFILKKYLILSKLQDEHLVEEDKKNSRRTFISDFDGDYVLDSCTYSNETGTFLCNSSRVDLMFGLPVGQSTDIPVVGNFNSDNITDIGVYRQGSKSFYIRYLGKFAPKEIQIITLSEKVSSNAIPKIDDYDKDYIDDFAVYDQSIRRLVVKQSSDLAEIELETRTQTP